MIVVHCQPDEHHTSMQGHYYACPDCGWCSRVHYGPHSRWDAQTAGADHQEAKRRAREYAVPRVTENTKPGMTPREQRRRIRTR